MSTYFMGQVVPLTFEVLVNGVPTDGGTVTLTVQTPDGTQTPETPTHVSTGNYSFAYQTTQSGHHLYRWLVTGTGATASEGEFDVRPAWTPGIVTVADVKNFLTFPPTDNGSSDTKIQTFIDAATEIIEEITGPLLPVSKTRYFDGGNASIVLPDRNVSAITSLIENRDMVSWTLTNQPLGSSVDEFGYTWDTSINQIVRRGISGDAQPFYPGVQNIACTYVVGVSLITGNILMAAEELITHWWRWGQQGNRASMGNPAWNPSDETFTASNGYAVPNRVLELLNPRKAGPGIA